MNVRPRNYGWTEFYDRLIDLTRYSLSWQTIARRAGGTRPGFASWLNLVRGVSSEGFGRIRYHTEIRRLLDADERVRAFFEVLHRTGDTREVPLFYLERIKRDRAHGGIFFQRGLSSTIPKRTWPSRLSLCR
jgi:hypothetical protein